MKKQKYVKSHRRNSTPWDSKDNLSCTEIFIKENYNNQYRDSHKRLKDTNEAEFLNDIKVNNCHWCLSTNIVKNGKYKTGIIRYHCKNCGKNFNIFSNTLLDHHKLNSYEQIKNMLDIFCGVSFRSTSKIQRNSPTTTKYWFKKAAIALESYVKSIILSGNIYMDTMFISVEKKKIMFSNGIKKFRGLSQNLISVLVATDLKHIIAIELGTGKPSGEQVAATMYERIEKGSNLYCDEDNSFLQIVQEQELKIHSYNSKYLKTLSDDENPIQPVNDAILLISAFLDSHKGFDRDELQDYLNMVCFNNIKGVNKLKASEMLLDFILNKSFETAKTLRYRKYYEKKQQK